MCIPENPEGYAVIISDRADVYSLSDIGLLFGAYALLRRNKAEKLKKARCTAIRALPFAV